MGRLSTPVVVAVLAMGGCAGGTARDGLQESGGPVVDQTAAPPGPVELRVAADGALSEVLTRIEPEFEARNPNVDLIVSYPVGADVDLAISEQALDGPVQRIGRLRIATLDDADGTAGGFVTFLREGAGQRILIDAGLLRP